MNKQNNDFDPYNGILLGHKNEVLICATTWMNLENTVLRSQSQKTTYYMIPFSWSVRTGKSIETKIDLWFPWSWENWAKMGSVYFVVKLSYNWLRWWLHSSVNLLEVTEVYILFIYFFFLFFFIFFYSSKFILFLNFT